MLKIPINSSFSYENSIDISYILNSNIHTSYNRSNISSLIMKLDVILDLNSEVKDEWLKIFSNDTYSNDYIINFILIINDEMKK